MQCTHIMGKVNHIFNVYYATQMFGQLIFFVGIILNLFRLLFLVICHVWLRSPRYKIPWNDSCLYCNDLTLILRLFAQHCHALHLAFNAGVVKHVVYPATENLVWMFMVAFASCTRFSHDFLNVDTSYPWSLSSQPYEWVVKFLCGINRAEWT